MAQAPPEYTPTLKVVLLGDLGVGKTCLRSQLVHRIFSGAYKATIGADYLTTTILLNEGGGRRVLGAAGEEHRREGRGGEEDGHKGGERHEGREGSGHKGGERHERREGSGQNGDPTKVSLQVWDTAGQERFNSISQAFYRGADVAVFVYDITNYESLLSVREWFSRFMAHCKVASPAIVIVGNKMDRADRAVELAEVRDVLCRRTNLQTVPLDGHVDWALDVMEASAKDAVSVEAIFHRVALLGSARPEQLLGPDLVDLSEVPKSSCAC